MSTSAFAGLIDDLKGVDTETADLAKSVAEKGAAIEGGADADDEKIAAAAAAAAEADDGKKDDEDDDKDGKPMAKSFQITLEDGTVVEAVDGADMIKSLMDRVEKNEGDTVAALSAAVETVKAQGELIKSLVGRFDDLSGQARPRKAVLVAVDKPAAVADQLAKSQGQGDTISSEQLMAKAMDARAQGRVSGMDIAVAEQEINAGRAPSNAFIKAVLSGE